MKLILILFLVSILALSVVGFWYWQKNSYSKDILKLEILAPSKVSAGEGFDYLVKIENNGKVRLEDAELVFQAPDNAVLKGLEGLRITKKIEDIYPGEERSYSFPARLFGKENDILRSEEHTSELQSH